MIRKLMVYIWLLVLSTTAFGQDLPAKYHSAEAVDTLYSNKVWYAPNTIHWLKEQHSFWYQQLTPEGERFVLVNAETMQKSPLFDPEKLSQSLSKQLNKTFSPAHLPIGKIEVDVVNHQLMFEAEHMKWQVDLKDYAAHKLEDIPQQQEAHRYWGDFFDEKSGDAIVSPDSVWTAFIKDSNVYIKNIQSGASYRLSYDGTEGEFYAAHMKWSPDGQKLMAYKVRPGDDRQIFFVQSSPADQLQPKLCYRDYLKPGDALPIRKPQLFDITTKKHIPVNTDAYSHQFSLSEINWRSDSRAFTFEYNQRGHQRYAVVEVDATTGAVKELINETSPTFIDYSSKKYRYDVADGKEIIWASERDGWHHLYLYDGHTGKVKNQITKGKWVVRSVVYVDEENRQIIFTASGLDKSYDPYLLQYCKVNFDGSGFTRLTSENGNHNATFSDDYQFFVDQYSRMDAPPVTLLKRASDGKKLMDLEKADIQALQATGWQTPEVFSAKGRDGKTDIWGLIIKPSNFDPNKKYPVIEYIYAGPHSSHVPKSFRSYLWSMHALAELGFIMVQIDGMGTSNRSKAFHDVCWKNLKDAGFPDRIAWMKAAAKKRTYMDISRVGIYGISAGAQNAAGALVFHPEFYKVAVASCGCHDNRMDKIWWNEQWMGYPVGPQYEASSNVVNAAQMKGHLMLTVGEMDDNVDPATTMQFADALIKAHKDFELVVLPGMGHSGGGEFGERKRRDFFVKYLMGIDPPAWEIAYPEPEKNEKIN